MNLIFSSIIKSIKNLNRLKEIYKKKKKLFKKILFIIKYKIKNY